VRRLFGPDQCRPHGALMERTKPAFPVSQRIMSATVRQVEYRISPTAARAGEKLRQAPLSRRPGHHRQPRKEAVGDDNQDFSRTLEAVAAVPSRRPYRYSRHFSSVTCSFTRDKFAPSSPQGRVVFPLQVDPLLRSESPNRDFSGQAKFMLVEQRPRMQSRRAGGLHARRLANGDAVILSP